MGNKGKSQSKLLPLLLSILAIAAVGAAVSWGLRNRRANWLETATIDELSKAASKDETDIEVFLKLALRAREEGDWPRAARAYGHACELSPDRLECWVGWARSIYEFADYAAADNILSDYIKRHPDDGHAYVERAALRRDAKRNDRAWEDINKAVALLPKEGNAWALKGEICIDMGTFQDAQQNFKTAKQFLPDSPWPLMGMYHSSTELKSLKEAEEAARELRRRFPDQQEGRLYLGEVLLLGAKGESQVNEAIAVLKEAEAVAKKSNNIQDWEFTFSLLLGRAYYVLKDHAVAIKYLLRAVEITPDSPDALYYLGRTYRAMGNEKKAVEVLEEHRLVYQNVSFVRKQVALLNSNSDDFVTRLRLARWYRDRKAFRSAQVHYEELVSRNQGGAEAKAELDDIRAKIAAGLAADKGVAKRKASDAKTP